MYVADKLTQLNVNLPSLMYPSLTTVMKEKEFDESKMLMKFFCLFFLCIFFEFLCHQTVILMLKSTCELYRIIRKVLLLLGSTVDFCYVSASHPQPSSRCEILANAQPSRGPAGFTHDFQILKVARLRPSCLTSLAKREKSFDRVVLVSSQRNVDVTFVDDLLCHTRGYSQNSGEKKETLTIRSVNVHFIFECIPCVVLSDSVLTLKASKMKCPVSGPMLLSVSCSYPSSIISGGSPLV